jgi:hypothetical protein
MENDLSRLAKFLEAEFKLVVGDKNKENMFHQRHTMAVNTVEKYISDAKKTLDNIKQINKTPIQKPPLLQSNKINQLKPLEQFQSSNELVTEEMTFGIKFIQVILPIPKRWLINYKVEHIIQPDIEKGKNMYHIDILSIPKEHLEIISDDKMILNIYMMDKFKRKIKILVIYNKTLNNPIIKGSIIQSLLL